MFGFVCVCLYLCVFGVKRQARKARIRTHTHTHTRTHTHTPTHAHARTHAHTQITNTPQIYLGQRVLHHHLQLLQVARKIVGGQEPPCSGVDGG
jgi:hypothetical protein